MGPYDLTVLRNLLSMTSDGNIPPEVIPELNKAMKLWEALRWNETQEADYTRQAEDHGGASDLHEVREETWTHPRL